MLPGLGLLKRIAHRLTSLLCVAAFAFPIRADAQDNVPRSAPPNAATNQELARFLGTHIELGKLPTVLKIAVVIGSNDLGSDSERSRLVTEAIRNIEASCGIPIQFVAHRAEYLQVVVFTSKTSTPLELNPIFEHPIARKISEIVGRDGKLDVQVNAAHGAGFDYTHRQVAVRWNQLGGRKLLPLANSQSRFIGIENIEAQSGSLTPETRLARFRDFYRSFFQEFLQCPAKMLEGRLRRESLVAPSELIIKVLQDNRILAGMTSNEVHEAALKILQELRPNN